MSWSILNVFDAARYGDTPPLEWMPYHIDPHKDAAYFESEDLCHSLYICICALANLPYPQDGTRMETFLRLYIVRRWNHLTVFDDVDITWKELIGMNIEECIGDCIDDEIFIMAFMEVMTRLHMPVAVRLFFAPFTSTLYIDDGPHLLIDISLYADRWVLLKTNSMRRFSNFSSTTSAYKNKTSTPCHDLFSNLSHWLQA